MYYLEDDAIGVSVVAAHVSVHAIYFFGASAHQIIPSCTSHYTHEQLRDHNVWKGRLTME